MIQPDKDEATRRRGLDAQLDAALIGTFPASDPIAVGNPTATEHSGRPADRKAPAIDPRDIVQARNAEHRRPRRTRPERERT